MSSCVIGRATQQLARAIETNGGKATEGMHAEFGGHTAPRKPKARRPRKPKPPTKEPRTPLDRAELAERTTPGHGGRPTVDQLDRLDEHGFRDDIGRTLTAAILDVIDAAGGKRAPSILERFGRRRARW